RRGRRQDPRRDLRDGRAQPGAHLRRPGDRHPLRRLGRPGRRTAVDDLGTRQVRHLRRHHQGGQPRLAVLHGQQAALPGPQPARPVRAAGLVRLRPPEERVAEQRRAGQPAAGDVQHHLVLPAGRRAGLPARRERRPVVQGGRGHLRPAVAEGRGPGGDERAGVPLRRPQRQRRQVAGVLGRQVVRRRLLRRRPAAPRGAPGPEDGRERRASGARGVAEEDRAGRQRRHQEPDGLEVRSGRRAVRPRLRPRLLHLRRQVGAVAGHLHRWRADPGRRRSREEDRMTPVTRPGRLWAALLAALMITFGLQTASVAGDRGDTAERAAEQVLTWTAGNDIDTYLSAPTTAVAGRATIVFENSEATGNTTGMPHTLTFVTSDPEFNSDVQLNILANPGDAQGGRHTAEVTLTPGRYFYHCTIPGHGEMQGILVVTEGGGEDTTAPEATAEVTGTRNAEGQDVGSASVVLAATDEGSGVERVEYAVGDDDTWHPYTAPVVIDQVGDHTLRYRALDKAGNVSEVKSVGFTVVAPPTDDTTPPETSATVDGERNDDGTYVDMATVTVTASDTGSGVNTVEYAIGDGAWQAYTGPVMVHRVGTHTVRYRATDRAGNVSAVRSVEFTVVAAPPQDTAPPVTGVNVEGTRNSDGAYVGTARVTVTA